MSSILPFITTHQYEDLVGIRIAPMETAKTAIKPFHIAFLIDTSGSMDGERITTVKRTLHLFTDEMAKDDRVTLISYNSSAHLVCKAESDTGIIKHAIDALNAGGGTNMETGLCKLLEVDVASMDAVFLLTDGEVNQGISSVVGLSSLVRSIVFDRYKIPVYTLGYGATHNTKLLQEIALLTRSSYTFADTNETLPSIVGAILVAMRDEVAKAVELEWEGGAICWEHGSAAAASYCVGSIISNKPQWIILKGNVTVLWVKTASETTEPTKVALNLEEVKMEDKDVLEQWFRVRSVKVFSEISEQAPMIAIAQLQILEDEIMASLVCDRQLLIRIRAEIAERRAYFDTLSSMPLQEKAHLITRFASNAAAFATQRGDEFNSPAQRQVSRALTHNFHMPQQQSQQQSQPPLLPQQLPPHPLRYQQTPDPY